MYLFIILLAPAGTFKDLRTMLTVEYDEKSRRVCQGVDIKMREFLVFGLVGI